MGAHHGSNGKRSPKGSEEASVKTKSYLAVLTPRQREIVLLVGSGYRNKEIANRLNITERTVKAHLSMVYLKLKLYRRVRLVHLISQ